MGVGTNTLGYSNYKIDKYVFKMLKTGNITLNSLEDINLAKKLLKLHLRAYMADLLDQEVRLMQLQLELQEHQQKNKIAICGYHIKNDWYLAANLKMKKSEDSLMKGLNIQVFLKLINTVSI